jgi:hypothetical protein
MIFMSSSSYELEARAGLLMGNIRRHPDVPWWSNRTTEDLMEKNGKGSETPPRKGSHADELDGASSHRSFRGARAPRSPDELRSPEEPRKSDKVIRPDEGELSPRD